jgi:hypothetical protein
MLLIVHAQDVFDVGTFFKTGKSPTYSYNLSEMGKQECLLTGKHIWAARTMQTFHRSVTIGLAVQTLVKAKFFQERQNTK